MSRGQGVIQRFITEHLAQVEGGELSANTLCWRGAEALRRIRTLGSLGPFPHGEMEDSYYKGYSRALRDLVEDGVVTVTKRRLGTPRQVLAVFPDLAKRLEVRALRQCVLPTLLEYATKSQRTHCSKDVEDRAWAAHYGPDAERAAALTTDWLEVRGQLDRALASGEHERELIIRLLVRGAKLFEPQARDALSTIGESTAMWQLVKHAQKELPAPLSRALTQLYDRALPRDVLRPGELKDLLFRTARFDQGNAHPELTDQARAYLSQKHPQIVPKRVEQHHLQLFWRSEPKPPPTQVESALSELLLSLLDRHIFEPVRFVSLA